MAPILQQYSPLEAIWPAILRQEQKNLEKAKDFFRNPILQCRKRVIQSAKESALLLRKPRLLIVTIGSLLFFSSGTSASDAAGSLDLGRWKGKVVIVDFWASWCVPCRRSFPWLNEMQAKYRDQGLVVIGVNEDASADDSVAFLKEVPAHFKTIRDEDGALAREFDVVAMPSSYILDRDGNVVTRHLGFKVRLMEEYEAVIREALSVPGLARND